MGPILGSKEASATGRATSDHAGAGATSNRSELHPRGSSQSLSGTDQASRVQIASSKGSAGMSISASMSIGRRFCLQGHPDRPDLGVLSVIVTFQ